ncbi:hypothetical protein AB6806_16390 [Bosea sp. RCC_152_1]|uniref:hypothetical protein n=1 Tax=Bosea sp. RCC_152_1 TaxID=3239228 RepID=UPI0035237963
MMPPVVEKLLIWQEAWIAGYGHPAVIPGLSRDPSKGAVLYDGSRIGAASRLVRDDAGVPCKIGKSDLTS